jgi:hypothetical protein
MNRSQIYWREITAQGEVNGRWAVETHTGTLVCDPAPGQPDDLTFTAPNGKRYWDTPDGSRWTPRDPV